jgi:hypothetical protein
MVAPWVGTDEEARMTDILLWIVAAGAMAASLWLCVG